MPDLKTAFAIALLTLPIMLPLGCPYLLTQESEVKTEPEPSIEVGVFQYIQDPKTGLCFAYMPKFEGLSNVSCTVCAKVGSCRKIKRQ